MLAAAALVLALLPARAAGPGRPETSPVVVAARDLPGGVRLAEVDLALAERTSTELPEGTLGALEAVAGQVLTGPVRAGEVLTDRRMLGPGLSAGLGPDMVASPVRLVDLDVVALLRAGDRVDILAAAEQTPEQTAAARVVAAGAVVLSVPRTADGSGSTGLVVLAVSESTAAGLALAALQGVLVATLLPA